MTKETQKPHDIMDNEEQTNKNAKELKKEVVRKIIVDSEVISKMKRITSLYSDEIPDNAKEIDVISFFFNKAFQKFLESGEIERKVKDIMGK